MVSIALGIGIYSYLIYSLGLLKLLYFWPVLIITLVFLLTMGLFLIKKRSKTSFDLIRLTKDRIILLSLCLIFIQIIVNFLGAISPELSFDALWYHLTAPKIYKEAHQIFYIKGELLWPSNLPKLTEMLYTASLILGSEILTKLIHFTFGILSGLALFNLLSRYFNQRLSVLGVMTFYTMLLVAWQSTTAYVELSRTFYEILALDFFLRWYETSRIKNLFISALMSGLAIAVKILSYQSLAVFVFLILLIKKQTSLRPLILFLLTAIMAVSPWLVSSIINTGNPVFPLFGSFKDENVYINTPDFFYFLLNFFKLILRPWQMTFYSDNFVSAAYLMFLPLVLLNLWRQNFSMKIIFLYFMLNIYFAPVFSNRYLLPFLPGLTILTMGVLEKNPLKNKTFNKFLLFFIFFSAILNLAGRIIATGKFVPYLLRQESKEQFLSKRLNFKFGDFYDTGGYFAQNIQKEDRVLIYGIHNLYYVNFPYDHESWAKKEEYYTHILVGSNQKLPDQFGDRRLVYQNYQTGIKLYLFGDKYK